MNASLRKRTFTKVKHAFLICYLLLNGSLDALRTCFFSNVHPRKPSASVFLTRMEVSYRRSYMIWRQHHASTVTSKFRSSHQYAAATASDNIIAPPTPIRSKRRIAIVGGGLAGLSTAFHLLKKLKSSSSSLSITIMDTATVGKGGASSVAGGLLHPLSPKGKLVHWGLEGMEVTNRLIQAACTAAAHEHVESHDSIILGQEIYRMALSDEHAIQLQQTANEIPHLAQWCDRASLELGGVVNGDILNDNSPTSPSEACIVGALRLSGQCQVIHVPSYLKGLWSACKLEAVESNSSTHVEWLLVDDDTDPLAWRTRLVHYDTVVWSAGSGMFSKKENSTTDGILADYNFPIQLVRGQAVKVRVANKDSMPSCNNWALLCGKYISPVPGHHDMVIVGATHEFQSLPLPRHKVIQELKDRTSCMAPWIWNDDDPDNMNVEQIVSGVRVQSARGPYGRRPLIGRLNHSRNNPPGLMEPFQPESMIHPNTFIFTGLSSRGLLYHGLYGDILTDAIVQNCEDSMVARCPDILFWRGS